MYIICDSGKRIVNTACVPCIGYEKCGAAYNQHYRVFAYAGNMQDDCELKYTISIHASEQQACFIVSYIAEMLQTGTDAITI